MDWSQIGWVDFNLVFLPAAREVLRGANPYLDPYFMSPPWALYPIIPLALLPDLLASLIWLGLGIGATLASLHFAARHFGMDPGRRRLAVMTLLAISPFSWAALLSGQFTPFVLLGVVGSFAWRGVAGPLLLLSLKPHLGILPALVLLIRRIRLRGWSELGWGVLLFALVAASGFLVVSGSTSFLKRMAYGNVYALEPQFMTSTLELLERLGFDPRLAVPLYILLALGLFVLLLLRDSLPLTAAAVLLAAPYARNYDYGLVLVPALYLIHRRFALWAVILLLLWPLYRVFVGDLSWTWTDIVVPITLMAFLLVEERRDVPGIEARR